MSAPNERAVLVSLATTARERLEAADSMAELEALVRAAGAEVADKIFQARPAPTAKFFIGPGKVEEIRRRREELGAGTVIFDHDLRPSQQRHLEEGLEAKVIDRTQLILDIFARRARSNEGQLQVELAQLSYLLPRLTGRGKELSRLGGGIGTRGPGETKLETDRRRIQARITRIKSEIKATAKRREAQRRSRRESLVPMVSIVGYTSAGKSTLFNRLAGQATWTSPQLFATLDPLVRRTAFPDGAPYFLSDTVGFVRHLPAQLVTAFRATLEEVEEADVLLHVVDASAPDAEARTAAVTAVLAEIGAGGIPVLLVGNKIDLLPGRAALLARNEAGPESSVYVSAATGEGIPALEARLRRLLYRGLKRYELRLPLDRREALASIERSALILKKRADGGYIVISLLAEPERMGPFEAFLAQGDPPP